MLQCGLALALLDRGDEDLAGNLGSLQDAKADEAPFVGEIEGAVDGPQGILGELGDEEIVAEVSREKGRR
jgi:hypothetical protein